MSPDLVSASDSVMGYTSISGLGSDSVKVPCVNLPCIINGVHRVLTLAVHKDMSPKTVLLGRDLGTPIFLIFLLWQVTTKST